MSENGGRIPWVYVLDCLIGAALVACGVLVIRTTEPYVEAKLWPLIGATVVLLGVTGAWGRANPTVRGLLSGLAGALLLWPVLDYSEQVDAWTVGAAEVFQPLLPFSWPLVAVLALGLLRWFVGRREGLPPPAAAAAVAPLLIAACGGIVLYRLIFALPELDLVTNQMPYTLSALWQLAHYGVFFFGATLIAPEAPASRGLAGVMALLLMAFSAMTFWGGG
ncbi:MAG TPA: hypothetical protein EYP85_08960 [Armatimonadetes bacterium]|nr:hypothetical protein [Armatimonadota bacterium]